MAKWIELKGSEYGETLRLRTDRIVGLRDMRQIPRNDGQTLSPDPYQTEIIVDYEVTSFMVREPMAVVAGMLAAGEAP